MRLHFDLEKNHKNSHHIICWFIQKRSEVQPSAHLRWQPRTRTTRPLPVMPMTKMSA